MGGPRSPPRAPREPVATFSADSPIQSDATRVKAFLDENGFKEISGMFLVNDIDGSTLLSIDREMLMYIGLETSKATR